MSSCLQSCLAEIACCIRVNAVGMQACNVKLAKALLQLSIIIRGLRRSLLSTDVKEGWTVLACAVVHNHCELIRDIITVSR